MDSTLFPTKGYQLQLSLWIHRSVIWLSVQQTTLPNFISRLVFTKERSLAVIKAAISSNRGRVTLLTGAIRVLLITKFVMISPNTVVILR
ncbi:hypothetical protein T01_8030 [Trichinella spiralis]|uniref:Uncharacterized protein n=2 Tax=Trichinella spiralis TaxID=6334 RepID=A0A0V1B7M9_TRISP|nr:hypothetical protein T01_8030 [Trichinella spiralis]